MAIYESKQDIEGRSSPTEGLRKNSDPKTCMKWSKKGDQKEDKCYNHDHYFVCGHPSVDCFTYSDGDSININSENKEACSDDKICVNTEGSFACIDATTTTTTSSTFTTIVASTITTTTTSTTTTTPTTLTTTTTTTSTTTTATTTTVTTTTKADSITTTTTTTTGINRERNCLNEAWELDKDGQCRPKDDFFAIRCSSDGIEVSIDRSLVPDAISFAFGTCPQKLNYDNEGRMIFKAPLDGCSTSMSMKNDQLIFSNTIRENFNFLESTRSIS